MAGDLFIVAGQSQAVGYGDPAPTVMQPPARWRLWSAKEGSIGLRSEPDSFGSFGDNSPWRDFAREWLAQTGREAVFLCMALGGTSMLQPAVSANLKYWDQRSEGVNCMYTERKPWINDAIAAMNLSKRFGNYRVFLIWDQGGSDAEKLWAEGMSAAEYQTACEALWARFLSDFPQIRKIGVMGMGQDTTAWDHANWTAVRNAQAAAVAAQPKADFIFRAAHLADEMVVDENGRWVSGFGTGSYADSWHYTGAANKVAGVTAAYNLAGMI